MRFELKSRHLKSKNNHVKFKCGKKFTNATIGITQYLHSNLEGIQLWYGVLSLALATKSYLVLLPTDKYIATDFVEIVYEEVFITRERGV